MQINVFSFGNTIDHTKDEIITIAAHPAERWGEGDGNGPIPSFGKRVIVIIDVAIVRDHLYQML